MKKTLIKVSGTILSVIFGLFLFLSTLYLVQFIGDIAGFALPNFLSILAEYFNLYFLITPLLLLANFITGDIIMFIPVMIALILLIFNIILLVKSIKMCKVSKLDNVNTAPKIVKNMNTVSVFSIIFTVFLFINSILAFVFTEEFSDLVIVQLVFAAVFLTFAILLLLQKKVIKGFLMSAQPQFVPPYPQMNNQIPPYQPYPNQPQAPYAPQQEPAKPVAPAPVPPVKPVETVVPNKKVDKK